MFVLSFVHFDALIEIFNGITRTRQTNIPKWKVILECFQFLKVTSKLDVCRLFLQLQFGIKA